MPYGSLSPWGSLHPWGSLLLDDQVDPTVYDGPSILAALQAWWADRPALHALVAPFEGRDETSARLWHLEAAEGQALPYLVVFTVSDDESEPRTTGYAGMTAVLQINAHAETDAEALAIRKAFRAAVLHAPLAVDGLTVRHVLPGGQGLTVGEGFGRGGRDSWVATVEVEISYETDHA